MTKEKAKKPAKSKKSRTAKKPSKPKKEKVVRSSFVVKSVGPTDPSDVVIGFGAGLIVGVLSCKDPKNIIDTLARAFAPGAYDCGCLKVEEGDDA